MPPDDSDACSSVATTPFQVFIQKDQSEDMEKLFLWVLNPEASGEGQAALEQGYELSLGSRFRCQ